MTNIKYRQVMYNESAIKIRLDDGMVSLTDMWISEGSDPSKKPVQWLRWPKTKSIILELEKSDNHKVFGTHLIETRSGKGGGTFAVPKLAIAYAEDLSPEFHVWALGAIVERIEEDANPELGLSRSRERAIAKWRSHGKTEKWIETRLKGVEARHEFTDELQKRGIEQPWQYGVCTNEIYKPILGGTTKEVKAERGIPAKANLRDSIDKVETAAIWFAEALATKKMEDDDSSWFSECKAVCTDSGLRVSRALE